jgi:hypothetical protein
MAQKVYKRGMLVCLKGKGGYPRSTRVGVDFIIEQVLDDHVVVCAVDTSGGSDIRFGKPFMVRKSRIIEGLTRGAGYDD